MGEAEEKSEENHSNEGFCLSGEKRWEHCPRIAFPTWRGPLVSHCAYHEFVICISESQVLDDDPSFYGLKTPRVYTLIGIPKFMALSNHFLSTIVPSFHRG